VKINRLQIEAPPSQGNGELEKLDLPVQVLVDLSFFFIFFPEVLPALILIAFGLRLQQGFSARGELHFWFRRHLLLFHSRIARLFFLLTIGAMRVSALCDQLGTVHRLHRRRKVCDRQKEAFPTPSSIYILDQDR